VAELAWFLSASARHAFEQLAGVQHAFFTSSLGDVAKHRVYVLTLVITVSTIGSRGVTITFSDRDAERPRVEVTEAVLDPADPRWSPHRYNKGALCMWHPKDSRAKRWVPTDGLPALLAYVRVHLVREAWWRDTGEWVGTEAMHADLPKTSAR
jgi:hypothetical protein